MMERIGICGAGAWGAALAIVAASDDAPVTLWARDPEPLVAGRLAPRLPGHRIPDTVDITGDLSDLADCDAILLVVPSAETGPLAARLAERLSAPPPLISCAKGLGRERSGFMHEVLHGIDPDLSLGALSGPSFAVDVAAGRPTAVTLACEDAVLARDIAARLTRRHFRVYPTDDLVGVEVGGAVKNVLAIACGVAAELKLGDSAEAALIARGLAEMTRLGIALGGRMETLSGLSGLGDLVLTCKGEASRNRRFGKLLAGGATVDAAIAAIGTVEGAGSAPRLADLARRKDVAMPITEVVSALVTSRIDIADAIEQLLARPIRDETGGAAG